tara:strand:- start:172 stop:717 length:546 start_codon:yes stop_codon:yes gene_type:complete
MKILLLFLVINFNTQVQMRKEIIKYLEEYIYTVEQRGNEYVNPFLVYTLYIHSNDNQDEIYYTMSNIINSSTLNYINVTHYFQINNNYIIVKVQESIPIENILFLNLKKITSEPSRTITEKLFDNNIRFSGFTTNPLAIILCQQGEKITKEYYGSESQITINRTIYSDPPIEFKIQQIDLY